jgi:hypothetical protein
MGRASRVALYLDFLPRPLTFVGANTVTGLVASMAYVATGVVLLAFFATQWFVQMTTGVVSVSTDNNVYQIELKCVSHTGCNVTSRYTANSRCAQHLADINGVEFYYASNQTFIANICHDIAHFGDGVVLLSVFHIQTQLIDNDRTWIAELVQAGRSNAPLPEIATSRRRVTTFNRRRVVKRLWSSDTVHQQLWDLGSAVSSFSEDTCGPLPLLPGFICSSYLLKPGTLFFDTLSQRRNSLWNDVWAPVSGLMAIALAISKCFLRVRVREDQLGGGSAAADVEAETAAMAAALPDGAYYVHEMDTFNCDAAAADDSF